MTQINEDRFIKDGEEKLTEALTNKKVALVERLNDRITSIKIFDNKENLIDWYKKEQKEQEYEYLEYKTAEEAYMLNSTSIVQDVLESFVNNIWDDESTYEGLVAAYNKSKLVPTYDEIISTIDKNKFPEGFYEFTELLVPFNGEENVNYERPIHFMDNEDDDFDNAIKAKASFQIYFGK